MTQPNVFADTISLASDILDNDLLGKGLKSPLVTDPNTGDFQGISGQDNVKQCIEDLLSTRVGERLMNEDLGSEIPSALFEDMEACLQLLPVTTAKTIRKFEPRVTNVSCTADQIGPTAIELNVSWTVKATGQKDSLVYPYYLLPPAGGVNGQT